MKNFLNSLAWVASLGLWFWITANFSQDLAGFFVGLVIWILIKNIFLNVDDISEKIEIKNQEEITPEEIYGKQTWEKFVTSSKIIQTENIENIYEEKTENTKLNKNSIYSEKSEDNYITLWISNFFKENLLAKIWAIIIFVWVFFLVAFLWDKIDDLVKIILWFTIWFSIFFIWFFLDKKWFIWESRILLWIWISINFLVILAWRYILFKWADENISIILTFLWLILNSVIWILTAIKYENKTLLYFSFGFAYINPLILWASSSEPYTLLIYSLILTISAIFVWEKIESRWIILLSFIFWNLLFLVATNSDEMWFLTKITFTIITSFIFLNVKTSKIFSLRNWKNNIFINSIIVLPIFLQSFTFTEITNLSFIVCFIYSIIIWLFIIFKTNQEKNLIFLSVGTTLLILLFSNLNNFNIILWSDWKINIFTFIFSIFLVVLTVFSSFIFKNFKNIHNKISLNYSVIISSLFLVFSSYFFVENKTDSGIFILVYAISYFVSGILVTEIYSIEDYKKSENKNLFFTFFSLFLAFASLSFIILFGNLSWWIISVTILFIFASLLWVLYKFSEEKKLLLLANFVSFIWFLKLTFIWYLDLFDRVIINDYFIIFALFIFVNLFLKEYLFKKEKSNFWYFLHSINFIILLTLAQNNIYQYGEYFTIFVLSLAWIFYSFLQKNTFKYFYLIFFIILGINQIFVTIEEWINSTIFYLILFFITTFYYQFTKDDFRIKINTSYYIFMFILLSIIVHKITSSIFSFAALWWIIWSLLIIIGVSKKKAMFRTIWLYLISLVFVNIIYIALFNSGDAITWTIILIILWLLFVWVSIFYTKYIWTDISKDFSLENIYSKKEK